MTKDEYAAWVRQYATGIGLDPAIAESVWQQESGGSLDTGLKGADLSRGRGNAVGPWQVVPYYHPQFPVGGDPKEQGAYAMNYLKKVGPAGYYGTGQAPAGHPTTDQYVRQVTERAGRSAPDVRQASVGFTNAPTGDPRTGRMDTPQLAPFPQMPQAQPPAQSQELNPLLALMMGFAAASGSGRGRISQGAGLAGRAMTSIDKADAELYELRQKRDLLARNAQQRDALAEGFGKLSKVPGMEDIGNIGQVDQKAGVELYAARLKAQQDAAQRETYAQQYEAQTGDAAGAAKIRAGYSPGEGQKVAEYGALTPVMKDGKVEWWRSNKYGQPERADEIAGSPPTQDPTLQGDIATRTAEGKAYGTMRPAEIQALRESMSMTKENRAITGKLLRELESGKYDGDLGPITGQIKQYWDPETAAFRAEAGRMAMEKLGLYNLKPVSNVDLGFMERLGAAHTMTKDQNIAILRDFDRWNEYKESKIKEAQRRIREVGFEDYLLDPISVDVPEWAQPYSRQTAKVPSAPLPSGETREQAVERLRKELGIK